MQFEFHSYRDKLVPVIDLILKTLNFVHFQVLKTTIIIQMPNTASNSTDYTDFQNESLNCFQNHVQHGSFI